MTPNCGSQNYGETIMSTPFNEQWQSDGWGVFYNAIEAKLKEKNT
jgi:hypothetical protein